MLMLGLPTISVTIVILLVQIFFKKFENLILFVSKTARFATFLQS